MPVYVLMTKLSPTVLGDAAGRRALGKKWLHQVEETCPEVTWIGHWALLGRYDFIDIYEAPDDETAHLVSYISRREGAVEAESLPAVAYDRYLELIEKAD